MGDIGVGPQVRPQIAVLTPNGPAEKGGLKAGDVFVAVNGERGLSQPKVIERIRANPKKPVEFLIARSGAEQTITINTAAVGGNASLLTLGS